MDRRQLSFSSYLNERPPHLFLPLHAAVLVPGLHLELGQTQRLGELDAVGRRQILVRLKLALQSQQLKEVEDPKFCELTQKKRCSWLAGFGHRTQERILDGLVKWESDPQWEVAPVTRKACGAK